MTLGRLVTVVGGAVLVSWSAATPAMGQISVIAHPSVIANVTVEDRWAVIYYVRALQRSQLASVEDVPEPDRAPFKK